MGGRPARTLEQFRVHFWSLVDKNGGPDACWPWTKGKHSFGYGIVCARVLGPVPVPTHRVAFWLKYGHWPTPEGRHTCDNPPCCNPGHVIEGTQAQNMQDCLERGRLKIGGRTSGTWDKGDTLWTRAALEGIKT